MGWIDHLDRPTPRQHTITLGAETYAKLNALHAACKVPGIARNRIVDALISAAHDELDAPVDGREALERR